MLSPLRLPIRATEVIRNYMLAWKCAMFHQCGLNNSLIYNFRATYMAAIWPWLLPMSWRINCILRKVHKTIIERGIFFTNRLPLPYDSQHPPRGPCTSSPAHRTWSAVRRTSSSNCYIPPLAPDYDVVTRPLLQDSCWMGIRRSVQPSGGHAIWTGITFVWAK